MSTFVVAVSQPQMLGTVMPSDMMGISTTTLATDSVDTHTNSPLLYYVMTTDQGNSFVALSLLMIQWVIILKATLFIPLIDELSSTTRYVIFNHFFAQFKITTLSCNENFALSLGLLSRHMLYLVFYRDVDGLKHNVMLVTI